MPDCGCEPAVAAAGGTPPVSGGANILSAARVDSWRRADHRHARISGRTERFVIAQGVDPRGLRLRLIDRARGAARSS